MVAAQRRENTRRGKKCIKENNPMLQADLVLNKLLTGYGFHTAPVSLSLTTSGFLAALASETICLSDCAGVKHSSGTRPAVNAMTSLFYLYCRDRRDSYLQLSNHNHINAYNKEMLQFQVGVTCCRTGELTLMPEK